MASDFSRHTFVSTKHYSGVLMQQGRVQLDADWNEQLAIHHHRTETQASDVIGPCGVPQTSDGFHIGITPDGQDLTISAGRIYVDGLLGESESTPMPIAFVPSSTNQIMLPALLLDGRPLQAGQWVEIASDDVSPPMLFQIAEVDPEQGQLTFDVDLTTFLNAAAPTIRRVTTYTTQPDYPNPAFTLVSPMSPPLSPPVPFTGLDLNDDTTYVVFLDIWQRDINAIDDPYIRELALGGPDTTTRLKTVWQVRLLPVMTDTMSPPTSPPSVHAMCGTPFAEWDQLTAPSTGMLNARTTIVDDPQNPCLLPPSSGYRRLENQLYRIEVHTGGDHSQATFKWSRDNASVETTVEKINGNIMTVADLGKDDVLGFAADQWVDIVDDESVLNAAPYPLVRINNVDPMSREIVVDQSVAAFETKPRLKLRRWDQTGNAATLNGVGMTSAWMDLEGGIQVRFSDGLYHAGDYWLIPARTITGEIDWPPFDVPNTDPIPQPPVGIHHHFCRLALLDVQGGVLSLSDCRPLFPPLTALTRLFYVSGGGQEAMPSERLPCPLQVGVMNGQRPVAGAEVQFDLMAQSGGLLHSPSDAGTSLIVETDANGIAACEWELGSANPNHACLQVAARLLDTTGAPAAPPIRFNANLSIASQVAYDPSNCPDLAAAGVRTVQEAIDALCQQAPEEEPGIEIERVVSLDGNPVLNDAFLPINRLVSGLRIVCDARLSPQSGGSAPPNPPSSFPSHAVPAKPTCVVTLDVPFPIGPDRDLWNVGEIVGFQPLILGSIVTILDNVIEWRPTDVTSNWLLENFFQRLNQFQVTDRILGHLTIKGNFIWRGDSGAEPTVYLDGEGFGRPSPSGRVDLRLPTGDGRRGGDFEMWFWILPPFVAPPVLRLGTSVITIPLGSTVIRGVRAEVRNDAGEAISGAMVSLTGPNVGLTAETNDLGQATFVPLASGTYLVTADFAGASVQAQVTVPGGGGIIPPNLDPVIVSRRTLNEVPGISRVFRTRLEENGISHPLEVAALEPPALAVMLNTSETQARSIIEAARQLILE